MQTGIEEATNTGQEDGDRRSIELEEKRIAEEPCSELHLQRVTGEADLGVVRNLVLTLDTNEIQVDHLGTLMPLLSELRLERGSTLASFRDLGSSLVNLRVLWLSACGVRHLDGVGALSSLEELYLAFNDVEDLTSIALHDRLEVLDLESNSVRDAEQAIQLGTCSRLWSLTLTANPVCRGRDYRRVIVEAVPQLASLDEEDVTDDDRRPSSAVKKTGAPEPIIDIQETFANDSTRHHHRSLLPNPAQPPFNENTKHRSTEQFPLGSACTGNRNLRELEMSGTFQSSRQSLSRGVVVPARSIDGVGASGGDEQATAVSPTSCTLSPTSYRWIPQSLGGLRGNACGEAPGETTASAQHEDSFSERLKGQQHGGGKARAGGAEDKDEAMPGGNSRGVGSRREADERSLENGRPEVCWQSGTATASVDEEEMVVKAIKNFRVLSKANTANESSNRSLSSQSAVAIQTAQFRTSSRPTTNECGTIWTEEDATPGKKDENRSRQCHSRGGRKGGENAATHPSVGHTFGQAAAGGIQSDRGRNTSGRSDFFEGIDWLLKVLSLEDMAPVATPRGTRAIGDGISDAASVLTHGSQMSIAGNPAFGLRRRRVPDQTVNTRSKAKASTSGPAPQKVQTRAHGTPSAEPGVERKRPTREVAQMDTTRRRPVTLEGPVPVRPQSAASGSGTWPSSELEEPSAAGGQATTGGGHDAEPALAMLAPALSWPRSGSGRNPDVREYGASGQHRQSDLTPGAGASLCCRALLSPTTRTPRDLRRVHRWPAVAERDAAGTAAESFVEAVEASKVGTGFSQASEAVSTRSSEAAANICTRTRNSRSRSRETRKSRGVSNSRSVASLAARNSSETAGCDEGGGREQRSTHHRCGTGGTSSSPAIGIEHPDGATGEESDFKRRWRDSYGSGELNGRLSSRGRLESGETPRGLKLFEVPEWSPTALLKIDHGTDREIGGNGSVCDGRDEDGGFRTCDAREQAMHSGDGSRDDGDGGGGSIAQPFAPVELVRAQGGAAVGEGVSESDEKLVALLRERPKNVPQIRTRESFRKYFRGMDRERLGRLLRKAYADRGSVDCDAKVKKRLMLLERSLDASFR